MVHDDHSGRRRFNSSTELLFSTLALGQVPCNFCESDQDVVSITNRCYDKACPEGRSILAHSPSFVFESTRLRCYSKFVLGVAAINLVRWIEAGKMSTDNFVGLIPFKTLGTRVPIDHVAFRIQHEDSVVL